MEKTVGCGGFAKVKLATHVATGEKVAIKIMEKAALGEDLPRVGLEISAMKNLLHQHICKLYQVIETEDYYFMVLEYCSGGELFDHIVEKSKLSESESRRFFRQIVSAVAYLHSLGYVHRDLKPENVLLDKDQNLKLIDFGLCAKPKGGMQSPLYTSCGSPAYAAPELILGNKYLGSEIDIWSLGVLLYALLCGFLPFDDNNIENIYKKILNGQYDEPSWMSQSSRRLIRAMLQIDPHKRITIKELCSHPWITAGFLNPITFMKNTIVEKDQEILKVLKAVCTKSHDEIWKKISENDRSDYTTATYLLLLDRKRRGLSICLSSKLKLQFDKANKQEEPVSQTLLIDTPIVNLSQSPRGRKRLRNKDNDDISSPVPSKKLADEERQSTPACKTPSSRDAQSTPRSGKVISEISKHLNKVRCVLTPKRIKNETDNPDEPITYSAKGLCNISSTSSDSPKHVLSRLRYALQCKGIVCRQKKFVLYGETEASISNVNNKIGSKAFPLKNSCSFELEVCLVKSAAEAKPMVGVRRKRLKGDAWVYKRVCEEVLALAAQEIPREEDEKNNAPQQCLI